MEIRKDVVWYEWYYQVSNMWNVRSVNRVVEKWDWERLCKWKEKKKLITHDWYYRVWLSKLWKTKYFWIHRLVLIAFIWNSNLQANHKNMIRNDNRIENLEWVTSSENQLHAWKNWNRVTDTWLWISGKEHPKSKPIIQYSKKLEFIRFWDNITQASQKLHIQDWSISSVCKWKYWYKTAWGFIFKYKNE